MGTHKFVYPIKCVGSREVAAKRLAAMMIVSIGFQSGFIKVNTQNDVVPCHLKSL